MTARHPLGTDPVRVVVAPADASLSTSVASLLDGRPDRFAVRGSDSVSDAVSARDADCLVVGTDEWERSASKAASDDALRGRDPPLPVVLVGGGEEPGPDGTDGAVRLPESALDGAPTALSLAIELAVERASRRLGPERTAAEDAVGADGLADGRSTDGGLRASPETASSDPAFSPPDLFEAVFAKAADAMVIADDEGTYVEVNDAAAALFGLPRQDLLGRTVHEFADQTFDVETAWDGFVSRDVDVGRFTLKRPDGETRILEYAATTDIVPGRHLSVLRDVTERTRRERELQVKDQALTEARVGIVITDPTESDNPIVFANDHFLSLTGYEQSEVVGRNCRFLQGPESDPATVARLRAAVDEERPVSVVLRNYRRDGTPFWNQVDVTPVRDEAGVVQHFVGFQRDVTDRRRYQRALCRLRETTRDLFEVETKREMYDRVLESVAATLPDSHSAFFAYESETDELVRRVHPSESASQTGFEAAVPVEGTRIGRAFVSEDDAGEAVVERVDGATGAEEFLVRLGAQGVLAVRSESGGFSPNQTEYVRLLADSLEAALDRFDRRRMVEARERRLELKRDELATLGRLNETIREANRVLIDATSRRKLGEGVCDRLAAAEHHAFAWLGRYDEVERRVVPTDWAGVSSTYVDALVERSGSHPVEALAREVVESGEMRVAEDVLHADAWRRLRPEAIANGFESLAVVPVTAKHQTDGVLVVGAVAPDLFGRRVRDVYAELGEGIGEALFRRAARDSEAATRQVDVELVLSEDAFVFNRLAEQVGRPIELRRVRWHEDGRTNALVSVSGDETAVDADSVTGLHAVHSVGFVSEYERGSLWEVTVDAPALLRLTEDYGATLRSVDCADGEATVAVRVPEELGVRRYVELVKRRYPSADLRARRRSDAGEARAEGYSSARVAATDEDIRSYLTDRQYQALEASYFGGFYEWPRASTSEELASLLDVSSPTFQYHRRQAERKLVARHFR
jgi:PAS domain S-box-containing protein